MKKWLIVIMGICPTMMFGQVVEGFDDGDFTANPVWNGDAGFVINGSNQLQSNGNPSGTDTLHLTTTSTNILNTEWTFYMKLAFNPTATGNYVKVFLTSDTSNLELPLNGYFVRIGETGSSDTLELWRKDGAAETRLLTGSIGYGNPVEAMIKVTRDSSGLWSLYSDPAAGTAYTLEGSVFDNTYTTSKYFGFYCRYSTTTRFDQYFFDDINIKTIVPDTIAPTIASVTVISPTMIDVYFDEAVDSATAVALLNYSINGGIGSPISITHDASNKALVHLTLGTALNNGTSYILAVSNVEDLSSNAITTINQNFTYFIPQYKDILINEIFPDPTPALGLPGSEFFELYNSTASDVDITGWEFSDGGTPAVFPAKILTAGSYLIVCATSSVADYSSYGDVLGLSGMPSLNNDGDDLVLTNSTGDIMDEAPYNKSWYNDVEAEDGGRSMELIDPTFPCINSANWRASVDTGAGTPGKINSVDSTIVDATPPVLLTSYLGPDSVFTIVMNEQLDGGSIDKANFAVDGGLNIDTVILLADNQSVQVNFDMPVIINTVYTLDYSSLEDCIGNLLSPTLVQFGKGIAPASANNLIINEIYPDESPSNGLPSAEFLEIYNMTQDILDLADLFITDFNDTIKIDNYTMLPGSYLILSRDQQYAQYGNLYQTSSMISLNNSGESIAILNADSSIHSSVTYSKDFYQNANKDDGGWSLELRNPDNVCGANYEANWGASEDTIGGTPGKVNSIMGTLSDAVVPELECVTAIGNTGVLVNFSEQLNNASIQITDYTIDNGITIASHSLSSGFDQDVLSLGIALQTRTNYTLTVSGVEDCAGNSIAINSSAQFGVAEDVEPGDVVINEILPNPLTGGVDFVELLNTSIKFLDLQDISFFRVVDSVYTEYPINSLCPVISPSDHKALTENKEILMSHYPLGTFSNYLEINDLPSYSDSEGEVIIGRAGTVTDSTVLDSVYYLDDWHYPLIDDEDGVSLERIDPFGPSTDPNNWHSAAAAVGYATPGYLNSQTANVNTIADNIVISPEIFTPDEDGVNDFMTISYEFETGGNTANITIFDSYGRLIKNLVQSELLATSGFYQWDGITEEGRKALMGNYVVLFEIFDIDGNRQKFKRIVSVGAQF